MKIFSGEPNTESEKCLEFKKNHNFLWNDSYCGIKFPFICETPYEVGV